MNKKNNISYVSQIWSGIVWWHFVYLACKMYDTNIQSYRFFWAMIQSYILDNGRGVDLLTMPLFIDGWSRITFCWLIRLHSLKSSNTCKEDYMAKINYMNDVSDRVKWNSLETHILSVSCVYTTIHIKITYIHLFFGVSIYFYFYL